MTAAVVMLAIEPLGWSSTAVGGRPLAGMLHGLAIELEAVWRACELADALRAEIASGGDGEQDLGRLSERLAAIASAAVPVGHDAAHLVAMLQRVDRQASTRLRRAGEHRREAVTMLRGWVRLARHGLLDGSRVASGLSWVVSELTAAGRALVAADAALLSCVGLPGTPLARE